MYRIGFAMGWRKTRNDGIRADCNLQEHSRGKIRHVDHYGAISPSFCLKDRIPIRVYIASTKKGQGELYLTDIYLDLAMNCMHILKFFAYFM